MVVTVILSPSGTRVKSGLCSNKSALSTAPRHRQNPAPPQTPGMAAAAPTPSDSGRIPDSLPTNSWYLLANREKPRSCPLRFTRSVSRKLTGVRTQKETKMQPNPTIRNRVMPWFLCALVWIILALSGQAQSPDLAAILSFETEHPGGAPGGWNIAPPGSVLVDGKVVHGGRWSARIERPAGISPSPNRCFSCLA